MGKAKSVLRGRQDIAKGFLFIFKNNLKSNNCMAYTACYCSKHFTYINSFHRTAVITGRCNYPHCGDEETEMGKADHIYGLR